MSDDRLFEAAKTARLKAYAPYSQFSVGAALRSTDGNVFTGCNVENVSFGLTMCAERIAVGQAILAGARTFDELTLVSESAEPVVPCGACRQVLAEFTPDLHITSSTIAGVTAHFELSELLPLPRQGILG
jgi:cytidine deaminase